MQGSLLGSPLPAGKVGTSILALVPQQLPVPAPCFSQKTRSCGFGKVPNSVACGFGHSLLASYSGEGCYVALSSHCPVWGSRRENLLYLPTLSLGSCGMERNKNSLLRAFQGHWLPALGQSAMLALWFVPD